MSRKQCKACPWRVDVVASRDIPGGYCQQKHCDLKNTMGDGTPSALIGASTFRLMACHESPVGKEKPCVGWMAHQLGPGNNIALRYAVIRGQIDADFELVGEQHTRFEDTIQ